MRKATFGLRTQDERKKESDRHKVKQEEILKAGRLERKLLGEKEREVLTVGCGNPSYRGSCPIPYTFPDTCVHLCLKSRGIRINT